MMLLRFSPRAGTVFPWSGWLWLWLVWSGGVTSLLATPQAYFVDGFHGGVYGHYPLTFTRYIVDTLREHPEWKLNLEIEPATWDWAQTNTPEDYAEFKQIIADQSAAGRMEYVNPAYGQSYLWDISGESIIQQFQYGMRTLRQHFPGLRFTTYASEEPCFTSALPGILKSLGFQYAVLKNPNTCWGGYTRAHGGELVNWIGPDGTAIPTVPRYLGERLVVADTWDTIGAYNTPEYIDAALAAGIAHPVGMCLQDAGWRNGPWLRDGSRAYQPTKYVTWRNYFEDVGVKPPQEDWHVSQEDVQVSLVWGAQVLQRIAQKVRSAENRIVTAEKMAALAKVWEARAWPQADLDRAWPPLLLSQHHDCWIVPYNGRRGDTWADKVTTWTGTTKTISDDLIQQAGASLMPAPVANGDTYVRVFNTLGNARTNLVGVTLPDGWGDAPVRITDAGGREVPVQKIQEVGVTQVLFPAATPALGYATYRLEKKMPAGFSGVSAQLLPDGRCQLENESYRMILDPRRGGAVSSLQAKHMANRELVDAENPRAFNELRGYFYELDKYLSTTDQPATLQVLESGPLRARVEIHGALGSNAVTQVVTLAAGEPVIDCRLKIDWQGSPGIGLDLEQGSGYERNQNRKAFYDDRPKLQVLFPLKLAGQRVFKDAPFDVTASELDDTFFDTWTGIKNNIILHWVDVVNATHDAGMTLFTDHTTSYLHGTNYPLGLTVQYSGTGLWGRDYSIRGPTGIHYALLPHAGDWEAAGVARASAGWNEPLLTREFVATTAPDHSTRSLLSMDRPGWEVPALECAQDQVCIRLYNPSAQPAKRQLTYSGPVTAATQIQLNGTVLRDLPVTKDAAGRAQFDLSLPPFGVGTVRLTP